MRPRLSRHHRHIHVKQLSYTISKVPMRTKYPYEKTTKYSFKRNSNLMVGSWQKLVMQQVLSLNRMFNCFQYYNRLRLTVVCIMNLSSYQSLIFALGSTKNSQTDRNNKNKKKPKDKKEIRNTPMANSTTSGIVDGADDFSDN